jgi:UDP-glucose 4-epimerase
MIDLLRFGRGLDNRLYKATGFRYGYTSREAVVKLGEHMRVQPVMRGVEQGYTYEREVEEFLRWSRHVGESSRGGDSPDGVGADRDPLGI